MSWALFFFLGFLAYTVLSWMGQVTGGSGADALQSATKLFTPAAFTALIIGNILWAVALYYGFASTSFALPILFSVGVMTGFFYSIFVLGATMSITKALGVVLILLGIYFLK